MTDPSRGGRRPAPARPEEGPKKKVKRRKPNPYLAWAKRLERTRPGLVRFTLDQPRRAVWPQPWMRRWDPTSELVLTILTQNSADINAEHAFIELRRAYPSNRPPERHMPGPGWGGVGLPGGIPPDWALVDAAPLEELVEVIRPGGLPNQKAKGIKAALRSIHEARGDYSLEFLGEMSALEARTWLTDIKGIGVKTASVVLLFSFGHPLMPVDRHVERVAHRVGLLPTKATPRRPTTTSWRCSSRTRCTRPTSTSSATAGSSATPATRTTTAARSGTAAASTTRRRPEAAAPR